MERSVVEANRQGWNRIAGRRAGLPLDHFRSGGTTLEDFERELAGDIEGRHVVHLACSFGDEVLSWANLGARATGVDISDVAIGIARDRAVQAGLTADFRCADMLGLPDDLREIDLFYLSWGAICWVPDLTAWATHLAARTRAGGGVLLCDHHPAWEVLAVRGENALAVAGDYFGRQHPNGEQDEAKRPAGAGSEIFQPFVWPISDVVMALVSAGFGLDAFFEAPEPAIYPGLGPVASALPAYYVVKATKR
jgi:SAM-dependent methyltransferase